MTIAIGIDLFAINDNVKKSSVYFKRVYKILKK